MIEPQRIRQLNDRPVQHSGRYVLYWMEASQRAECNHALSYAIERANELRKPLVAFYGLMPRTSTANVRRFTFMLQGLRETRKVLAQRKIPLIIQRGAPDLLVPDMAKDAALVVTDAGYLRAQRRWRAAAARRMECAFYQVESDVVVPVTAASDKEEYSAATLRPRLKRQLPLFLRLPPEPKLRFPSMTVATASLNVDDVDGLLASLALSQDVPSAPAYVGGRSQGRQRLKCFIEHNLSCYGDGRNDPNRDCLSHLSPYLHFGQISPIEIALAVKAHGGPGREPFLEELIVRRELARNFTYYNPRYDRYEGLPAWCRNTLKRHAHEGDRARYTLAQLQRARTEDRYWNAAQRQMVREGKMHSYMRMYWGKKLLEWAATPKQGFQMALRLNDKYELDGCDPNGYAGVAWCFGKHDRPWPERPVFGIVRAMNAAGLRRKFDADAFAERYPPGPRSRGGV